MGLLDFTTRSKVLGLPIGSKHTDWGKVAKTGAGVAAALAGSRAASKAKQGASRMKDEASALREKGEQGIDSANEIAETTSRANDAAAGRSSTFGKAKAIIGSIGSSDGDGRRGGGGRNMMKQRLIIQEQIDVAVPRRTAYDQWTQFEEFSSIFRAVQDVDQQEDDDTRWQAKVLLSSRQWKGEIVEQVPDQRIVWKASGDVEHRGVVTFHELDENLTRVQLEMEYIPTGFVEKFGNLFLTVRHRVRKDLRLYKHFIELEGEATGAWRGEIAGDGEDTGDDRDTDEVVDVTDGSDEDEERAEADAGERSRTRTKAKAR